jgi:DNA adenine methylase
MTPLSRGPSVVAAPFLKWAGGKSVIAQKIISKFGPMAPGSRYFEPFLGGGAVFFRFRPSRAVLLDSNAVLVRTYQVVKDNVEGLIDALGDLPSPTSKDDFEKKRVEFNKLLPAPASGALGGEDVTRAALLIWLNHTCFNGLYRVNREGKFNVPYGYYERAFIYDPENLRAASAALNDAEAVLIAGDYSRVVELATRGDVIYFDPPYQPPDLADGFTDYTPGGFGPIEQARLAAVFRQLIAIGCRPLLSNSNAADIRELYSGFASQELLVPRAINSDGANRGRVIELLIYPKHRATLHDLWDAVVVQSGWDLASRDIFEVTARRVKELTGQEPRLVAKMDTREALPQSLAERGYFVLPVTANRYALVPGDGYHDLENPNLDPRIYVPAREIPVTVALKAGESAAIQTALYSGLLEEVVGVPRLRETLHNDLLQLNDTTIRYGRDWSLRVNGARVELDAGFENHREFFVFECKHWYGAQLKNFNVRQLFYPYLLALRDLRSRNLDWKVRCFFLNVEPDTAVFRFWEYAFASEDDYSTIRNVGQSAIRLSQSRARRGQSALELLAERTRSRTDYIPQANDPVKLLSLVQGVAEGVDTPSEIARRLRFVGRQSHYYGEAAEELGLVERGGGRVRLTDEGTRLARMQTDEATHALIERIFSLPVFGEIAELALRQELTALPSEELEPILRKCSAGRYNETTLRRRSQSVQRWINWVGENTGAIRIRSTRGPATPARTLDAY